jgi:acetylornithine deacetylase
LNYLIALDYWLERNKEEILNTLSKLIQIKTENIPPGGNEKKGQEFLYDFVSNFISSENIDLFEIDDIKGIRNHSLFFSKIDKVERLYGNRPNLVVKLKGCGEGKNIVFSGHMDTMPAGSEVWKAFDDPFSGKIKDGKMYGRGSIDMKAGTIAGFFAIKCLKDLEIKLKGDVFAESVIDEENAGVNGTIAARLRNPNIDFAILAEPTDMIVGIETIGGSDWKVSVKEEGSGGFSFGAEIPNPIYKLSKIALALEKYNKLLKRLKVPESYKKTQFLRILTMQLFSGGSNYIEASGVPIEGHMYFWLEAFSNMKEKEVLKNFNDFMKKELTKFGDFKEKLPEFEMIIRFLEGHKTDINHPAMNSIKKSYKDSNIKYLAQGLPFACDAFAFKKVCNTEVVVIGPRGGNPHGVDEYVEIESIFELIKIMVLTAIDYCK